MDPEDDRNVVTVTDPEPVEPTTTPKSGRATTSQLLEAIQNLPDAVAARVNGETTPRSAGGVPEVTFVGEPPAEPDLDPEDPTATDADGDPLPYVEPTRSARQRGHPSRPRRREEALS